MRKPLRAWSVLIGVALSVSALTAASAETVDKPARVVSTIVKRAAIVEAVDKTTRELKLIDAQGNRFSVMAGPEVRNFDQLQPRDRIVTEYMESVAIIVAPAGSTAPLGDASALTVAPKGDLPGIGGIDTVLMTATVQGVNAADRLVTLENEFGDVRTIKVGDDVRLDLVDIGDQVRMRVTTAVAVNVERPE